MTAGSGEGGVVLITGATGFVGSHLATLCAEKASAVIGVARRPPADDGLLPELEHLHTLDLSHDPTLRDVVRDAAPERVFHLAADASVGRSWRDPATTLQNNLLSTAALLETVRQEAPSARVLVACSGEEYGPGEHLPITESAPLRPQNPYAVSKASADLLAGFYADAHGLHTIRTRAFNHAGPGQTDTYVVSALARQVAEAEAADRSHVTIASGDLSVRRDFTDVRDVVRAYRLALEHAEPGAYNVCSGRARPLTDILAALAKGTEIGVEHSIDPARVRAHEVAEIRGSHDKLTEATGWKPSMEFERTVLDALDWWRLRLAARR